MINDNVIYQEETRYPSSVSITFVAYTPKGEIRVTTCSDEEIIVIKSPELNIDLYLKNIPALKLKEVLDKMQYKTFLVAVHNLCVQGHKHGVKNIYKHLQKLLCLDIPKTPTTDYMLLSVKK